MAKLKIETNRDTELVRFDALEVGETFITSEGLVGIKTDQYELRGGLRVNAICLNDGSYLYFKNDALLTYVRSAELKLTI